MTLLSSTTFTGLHRYSVCRLLNACPCQSNNSPLYRPWLGQGQLPQPIYFSSPVETITAWLGCLTVIALVTERDPMPWVLQGTWRHVVSHDTQKVPVVAPSCYLRLIRTPPWTRTQRIARHIEEIDPWRGLRGAVTVAIQVWCPTFQDCLGIWMGGMGGNSFPEAFCNRRVVRQARGGMPVYNVPMQLCTCLAVDEWMDVLKPHGVVTPFIEKTMYN